MVGSFDFVAGLGFGKTFAQTVEMPNDTRVENVFSERLGEDGLGKSNYLVRRTRLIGFTGNKVVELEIDGVGG